MKSLTFTLAAIGLSLAGLVPPTQALAQQANGVRFGATAGLNVPLSTLSRETQTGLMLDAFMTGTPDDWPVALRGELSYSALPGASGFSSQHLTGLTLNALAPVAREGSAPYVLGGVGLYNVGSYAGRPSENDAGVDIGVGYRWRHPGVSYFAEVRIVDIAHTGASRQMVPILFGVTF